MRPYIISLSTSVQSAELLWPVSVTAASDVSHVQINSANALCKYPELFFSAVLSSLHVFDRLVNNAGGLCDDNRLGGTQTHAHTFSGFF